MKRVFIYVALLTASVIACIAAPASIARAALGDRVDSIAKDSVQLKATRKAAVTRVSASASYTVQELNMDGTTVREFVSSGGVVFAVSWRGLARPDLSQLLGSYYSIYKAARAAAPHAQRQTQVSSGNLIVKHMGHMRDLRGVAVLSNLIPDGVNVEDLQ